MSGRAPGPERADAAGGAGDDRYAIAESHETSMLTEFCHDAGNPTAGARAAHARLDTPAGGPYVTVNRPAPDRDGGRHRRTVS